MKDPLITIGILNYNGLNYLKKTLPPILELKYPNKEIVIVDNGSTDGSIKFIKKFKRINLILNEKNEGYGAGKNKIVNNSRGKYSLLLDSDILIEDSLLLQKLLSFYLKKKSISFLSFPLMNIKEKLTEHYGLFFNSRKNAKSLDKLESIGEFLTGGFIGGAVFFRNETFKKLGGYDEKYPFNLDDYDLSARSWIGGYKIYILTKTRAIHLGTENRKEVNSWSWKNKYYLCGFNRMVIKNYKISNLLIWVPLSAMWIFYKSLIHSLKFKSVKPIMSYMQSAGLFLLDLPDTLKKRKIIQLRRVIKKDIFLKIKCPQILK